MPETRDVAVTWVSLTHHRGLRPTKLHLACELTDLSVTLVCGRPVPRTRVVEAQPPTPDTLVCMSCRSMFEQWSQHDSQ